MKTDTDGKFKVFQETVPPSLEKGEEYVKILAEGQYLYFLSNKAVYRVKTGRNSSGSPASGTYVKICRY
ncbi:MAG: hypothetical protein L6V93_19845 [Clostridiales bacterium]|nr:MAG: hypothetical protein L6V93_19845 [Clostridiales bacterium]